MNTYWKAKDIAYAAFGRLTLSLSLGLKEYSIEKKNVNTYWKAKDIAYAAFQYFYFILYKKTILGNGYWYNNTIKKA